MAPVLMRHVKRLETHCESLQLVIHCESLRWVIHCESPQLQLLCPSPKLALWVTTLPLPMAQLVDWLRQQQLAVPVGSSPAAMA